MSDDRPTKKVNRDKVIVIRVTEDEHEDINMTAHSHFKSMSSYIRDKVLGYDVFVDDEKVDQK